MMMTTTRRHPVALGIMLLSLLAGCTNSRPKPPEGGVEELVQESEQMSQRQGEIARDLERLDLVSANPERDTEKELVNESAKMTASQKQLLQRLQKRNVPTPDLDPVLPRYNPLDDIMVSLEMDNTDVRHVLIALAKETGMNLLINPEILQNPPHVSISFRNVPASTVFREVLRIADLYGRVENNVLRVDPYQEEVFHLDILDTNTTSSFSAGGNVLGTSAAEGGGGGAQLSGTYQVSGGSSNTNPYNELNAILGGILAGKGSYQLNPMSGILYVRAKPSAIRTASDLVARYKRTMGRQVLIDARILEVRLTDNFQAGVDWAAVRNKMLLTYGLSQTLSGPVGAVAATLANTAPDVAENTFGLTYRGASTTAILKLLKQYGNIKVLSNPTIRAKHSQPALISVGQSNAYVRETDVTTTTGTATSTETDVTVDTVFDGLLIGVTPFITEDGRINLSVHPVQSSVDTDSLALTTISTNAKVSLPKVDLKELSTVLEMRDGDTVLLGGLIDKRRTRTRDGVPVLAELPVAGRLFKNDGDAESVRELVIILKVTIL